MTLSVPATAREWHLTSRPGARFTPSDLTLVEAVVPRPGPGSAARGILVGGHPHRMTELRHLLTSGGPSMGKAVARTGVRG